MTGERKSGRILLSIGPWPSIQVGDRPARSGARNETMSVAMKIQGKTLSMILLAGVVLSGCQHTETVPVATEPDLVGTRIAQAAEKSAKALDTMSGIEQYREPQMPPPDDYSMAPPELKQSISVRWAGPMEQMVDALAQRAGMRVTRTGNPPSVPLLVTVDVYQKPLIEVLHSVGLQAGRRADLSVNSALGTIEIRYAPVDRI